MNSYSDSLLTQRSDQRAIEEIDISQLIEILWRQKFLFADSPLLLYCSAQRMP